MKHIKLKSFLFVALLAFSYAVQAQTIVGNTVQIYNNLVLHGTKVTGITSDTALTANDSMKLPTEYAVKGYVDNRIDGLTLTIGHTYIVPSQDSMLNLTASIGDVASIPDSNKTYILKAEPTSDFSNWVLIVTPAQVISVYGRTGNVTAQYGDYDYSQIANTPTIPDVTGKLNISDTASMLNPYAKKDVVATKLNIADTAAMLAPYAKTDLIPDVTGKLNISDTASMLNPYATKNLIPDIGGKVNIADTAAMLSSYATKNLIPNVTGKLNISDTASMLSPYKIAYNGHSYNYLGGDGIFHSFAGVGGSGGTNDPDSLNGHAGSEYLLKTVADAAYLPIDYVPDLSSKVNVSDTAAMLAPYLRKDNKFPMYLKDPLYAVDDTTAGLHNLILPELRYNFSSRDTANWKDTTLIDKKYLNDRIAGISAGGITTNYVDTTSQPNDSTIRIHFAEGNYVDYIIRTSATIDTSHLSDRIDANAANIAANTTAIAGKADKATTLTINGVTYDISANRTWTINTGGTDTAFKVITALNLKGTIPANKGLVLRDTTLGTTGQNSPPMMWQGRNNGKTTLWAAYVDGNASQGSFKIVMSTDSGTTWTNLMTIDKFGGLIMPSTATFSSYVTAPQFAGALMSFYASAGNGIMGANRQPNPNAQLDMVSTTKGILIPQMSTDQRQTITGSVKRGILLSGGSGYTGPTTVSVFYNGGHGTGQGGSFTLSGGSVVSFTLSALTGKNYRIGDTLSWDGNGGTGFKFLVSALTGDTSKNLMVSDTTIGQIMVWNGESWQGEIINSSASTLDVLRGWDITFTGSTATYTLPSPTTAITGAKNGIKIMNLGSGNITINSNTGSTIMPKGSSTAASTITVAAGAAAELYPTATYFKVLYNN